VFERVGYRPRIFFFRVAIRLLWWTVATAPMRIRLYNLSSKVWPAGALICCSTRICTATTAAEIPYYSAGILKFGRGRVLGKWF
jgi:hypothetical protein